MRIICENLSFEKKGHDERQVLDPDFVKKLLNQPKPNDNYAFCNNTIQFSRRHLESVK